MKKRAPRSDAIENRDILLKAAETVFAEHGATAPLTLVVEESGLGRGTLYRHFPTREALVAALYDARLDRYERSVQDHAEDGQALHEVLRMIAWDQYKVPGLLREIQRDAADSPEYGRLWDRTESLVRTVLAAAKSSGVIREDITEMDIFLAISMFYGVANSPPARRWGEEVVHRSLALMHRTLSGEPGAPDSPSR